MQETPKLWGQLSMQSAKEILRRLVAIPSVSSLSNHALLDEIHKILGSRGWHVERQVYQASDGLEKANLIAFPLRFRETLPNVELLFVCHTDTVPFRQEWSGAVHLEEVDGELHGCGSCDVKGSLACLLSAALQVDPEAIALPVAYAFTAEEEIGCIGATKLVASEKLRPRRVIVCEPTSLRPATAGKGYGLCEVQVVGREAHSAFPAKGASAIQAAAQVLVSLEHWQKDTARTTDARFSPPVTTFNVGVLRGGSAKNIVAGDCSFLVEWRPLPSEPPEFGGEIVRSLVQQVALRYPECRIEVKVLRADRGFANDGKSRLGPALSAMLSRPEIGISFGSEATRFAPFAEDVVVVGPGDMETAHSERECVPVRELEEWTSTVTEILVNGIRV